MLRVSILGLMASSAIALNDLSATEGWGYHSDIGPKNWYTINSQFELCRSGLQQSPINLVNPHKQSIFPLEFNYLTEELVVADDMVTQLTLDNELYELSLGRGIQVNLSNPQQSLKWRGQKYRLIQYHFHTPAQHEINGQKYPLEIEFVHQGAAGRVLLLSVLVEYGKENSDLAAIAAYLPKREAKPTPVAGIYLSPLHLIPKHHSYFSYTGSLTVPPCIEGIEWIVMSTPLTASKNSIERILKAGEYNARPVQALHARLVNLNYLPTP